MEARLYRNSFLVSLLLHALFCAIVLFLISPFGLQRTVEAPKWVEIEVPPWLDQRNQQVVQSNTGEKVQKAEKDAFLGKETRRVDRETIAKVPNSTLDTGAPAHSKRTQQTQAEKGSKSTPNIGALANLGVPIISAQGQKPEDAHNWNNFSDTFGQVPTDYVKGLKESEQSALNTREFVYYTYFQRIRTQLDHAWEGILRDNLSRLYRNGRSLASDMDHTTRTVVTLDAAGAVIRVQIIEESGVFDLDDAAVKAFNKAGPFPNPPHEMVDSTGKIEIRWDFVLKT